MAEREDVCVLIPTLNEAETIGEVIDGFTSREFENVLVVDGHSTDETTDIARDHGARVIQQSGSGKGQAIREAVQHIETEYVLMLDGDGTYRPEDADKMLEPIVNGKYEHVIGDRFADMEEGAMSRLNKFGNGLFNWVFRHIHGKNFEDILSGYRAFTRDSVENFYLDADGFGVETEMAVECVKHGIPTIVVPVRYETRPDGSDTNLHPLQDGGVILITLYQLAKTNNPLFYFGSVGMASSFVGVILGAYVGVEWVTQRISHEVLAVVAAFAILFGVQLLMFGVLSDLIVTLHREQMRRLE
jgi:glycosyltransferase (TIGR04182 family)